MKIRKAKQTDVGTLVGLAEMLATENQYRARSNKTRYKFLTPSSSFRVRWKTWITKWLKSKNGMVLIAENNGCAIGYSLSMIRENIPVYQLKKIGHIQDIYILPEHRKTNDLAQLEKENIKWFRKNRVSCVAISVHDENKKLYKKYCRWGFFVHTAELLKKI